jgi:hypothetical protein
MRSIKRFEGLTAEQSADVAVIEAAARKRLQRSGRYNRLRFHRATPYGKFAAQRSSARQRGIAWNFTFAAWWSTWAPFWARRGFTNGKLSMGRKADRGAYEPGNVEIIEVSENNRVGWRNRRPRKAAE